MRGVRFRSDGVGEAGWPGKRKRKVGGGDEEESYGDAFRGDGVEKGAVPGGAGIPRLTTAVRTGPFCR